MSEPSAAPPGALSQLLEELARVPRLAVAPAHFEPLPPGAQVGRFVIEREIGRGGFGVVYAARDPELGRPVALKLLRRGVGLAQREGEWIRREAAAVARLGHPNIVTIFDVGQSPHGPYLVFELLQGETLADRLDRAPLPAPEAARVALAVAEALAHAHQAGVLHRDLKPANVFLCASGAVKVLDFGVAHLFGAAEASRAGTPGFMAPEQRDGRAQDARTDLFALGLLLEAMLRGGPPAGLEGPSTSPDARPSPRASRRTPLLRLVRELTQEDPAARPASAGEVLPRLGSGGPGASSRRWWLFAAAAAAGLALAAAYGLTRPTEAAPGEVLVVSVAPTENATGLPELDGVAEMVATALGESRRLRVVPPERLTGAPLPAQASPRQRASGAGAVGLIQATVRRSGEGFELSLRFEDTGTGALMFEGRAEVLRLASITEALDGLLLALRRGLREREADLVASARSFGQIATSNPVAWMHYQRGLACIGRVADVTGRASIEGCGPLLRSAIEADPAFALAHYELGYLLSVDEATNAEAKGHLDTAAAAKARLSRRDVGLLEAWQAHLAGDEEGARQRYASLLAEYPDDLKALVVVGELAFHSGRPREAAPYLAKVLELAPGSEWALDHLVDAYAVTGQREALRGLLARLTLAPSAAQHRALVHGHVWLEDPARAVAVAEAGLAEAPTAGNRYLLLGALMADGRFDEALRHVEELAAAAPENPIAHFSRIALRQALGRQREAWQLASRPTAAAAAFRPVDLAFLKATLAAGQGDPARLAAEASKLSRAGPEHLPVTAVMLALVGGDAEVKRFEAALVPGSNAAIEVSALRAWKRGAVQEALAALTELEQRAAWPSDALAPAYLIAVVALQTDPAEALAAAARFRAQWPRGFWRAWAFPHSLLVSARAAAALGDMDGAAGHAAELQRILQRADADSTLARDLARFQASLSTGPSSTTPRR